MKKKKESFWKLILREKENCRMEGRRFRFKNKQNNLCFSITPLNIWFVVGFREYWKDFD